MFDFNFRRKTSTRTANLFCLAGLISLILIILVSRYYLPFKRTSSLIKSRQAQEKLGELKELDFQLARLSKSLDLIEEKSEVDLVKLLEIVYLEPGIEKIERSKDGLVLRGESKDKENIFKLKSQLEKGQFKFVEIEEVNLSKGSYSYYIQCDGHEKN